MAIRRLRSVGRSYGQLNTALGAEIRECIHFISPWLTLYRLYQISPGMNLVRVYFLF